MSDSVWVAIVGAFPVIVGAVLAFLASRRTRRTAQRTEDGVAALEGDRDAWRDLAETRRQAAAECEQRLHKLRQRMAELGGDG